jgi:hypothetical protein
MNRADSMVPGKPCDDHSSGFLVGLPLVGDFESKRLVPIDSMNAFCNHYQINTLHYLRGITDFPMWAGLPTALEVTSNGHLGDSVYPGCC